MGDLSKTQSDVAKPDNHANTQVEELEFQKTWTRNGTQQPGALSDLEVVSIVLRPMHPVD